MTGFYPDNSRQFIIYSPNLLKIANSFIYMLDRIFGRVMTLKDEKLIQKACKKTGLNDFGDNSFREALRILCEITQKGPRMTAYGRYFTRIDLLRRLMNKLRIQADITIHTEILDEKINKPIFIIGLPRSGTTFLHRLLAQDPANRTLKTWEMNEPSPPPERSTSETDPRIKKMEKAYSWMYYAMPALKAIHEVDARTPEECILLMANGFISEYFTMGIGAHPDYSDWLYSQDLTSIYTFHKQQLQLLQWKYPTVRWVLKAPFHLHGLKWLLDVYSDARILHVHRNPLEVLPSAASLLATTMACVFSNVDPVAIGQKVTHGLAGILWSGIKARLSSEMKQNCQAVFLDIYYKELVADPISTVRKVYNNFGLNLSDKVLKSMQCFLDKNPQYGHGRHRYTLDMFGLKKDTERRRFRRYIEYFGLN